MKTKRTVNHGSTKKNKRTMSGGKGIISTYTRRFKDRYKKFIGISDTDDTKKIKKLEAWGGLTGIYKFLEVDKKTFKNTTGDELSALEKMKENIENTPNSSNKDGYTRAIQCLQKGGDNILLNNGCVSYDVFVNGGDADDEVDAAAPAVAADAAADDAAAKDADVEDPADDDAAVEDAAVEDAAVEDAAVDDAAVTGKSDDTQAPVPVNTETGNNLNGSQEQGGGGSKRRPKSSRRVKFSKSKKSRTTRRLMRKHRK